MKRLIHVLLVAAALSPIAAVSEVSIDECSLQECVQFKDWFSGRYEFASGKQVFVAETYAYNGAEKEHLLSLVHIPGQCDKPRPYFRIPFINSGEPIEHLKVGQFRFNVATFFDYHGHLYWPHGRIGTIVINDLSQDIDEFVRLIKYGNSLDSINYYDDGGSSFYEYLLNGSLAALNDASKRCAAATTEPNEMPTELADQDDSKPLQCSDLSILSNPAMASSFDYINSKLLEMTGKNLDQTGILYDVVCLDLRDGYTPEYIVDSIVQAMK